MSAMVCLASKTSGRISHSGVFLLFKEIRYGS